MYAVKCLLISKSFVNNATSLSRLFACLIGGYNVLLQFLENNAIASIHC